MLAKADVDLIQAVDDKVEFVASVLPDDYTDRLTTEFAKIESVGLSVRPYIGSTVSESATFLCELIRRLIKPSLKLSGKGRGAAGWSVRLASEYEFQDLFWISIKPWLPTLARQELAIIYDGQHKYADFSLFANSIVIEKKHVKDANTKAWVAKTLKGRGR